MPQTSASILDWILSFLQNDEFPTIDRAREVSLGTRALLKLLSDDQKREFDLLLDGRGSIIAEDRQRIEADYQLLLAIKTAFVEGHYV